MLARSLTEADVDISNLTTNINNSNLACRGALETDKVHPTALLRIVRGGRNGFQSLWELSATRCFISLSECCCLNRSKLAT